MQPEVGIIWVYSLGQTIGVKAFTAYGVECLCDLIREQLRS